MSNIIVLGDIKSIKFHLIDFKKYNCVVIISKYNSGKSSVGTNLIHEYFGEDKTYYVTFIDQSKPNFTPRESKLKFGEIIKDKIIVFDELNDDKGRSVDSYAKKLIEKNFVIILSNPYASSNDVDKEIDLFKKQEKDVLPSNVLFIFVKSYYS